MSSFDRAKSASPKAAVAAAAVLMSSLTLTAPGWATSEGAELPDHPRKLTYGPLQFEVPQANTLRHQLPGGQIAYVVEDHTLPLVEITAWLRGGGFLDPADKVGLSTLTASMMRRGGAADLAPDDFEERVDFLAAELGASAGDTTASATVNCVRTALEECLDLFFDMLRTPRFDEAQLRLEKQNLMEQLKQRNDEAAAISAREWEWLLFGQEHPSTRRITGDDLEAIDSEELARFHRRFWRPENLVFSISGDVEAEAILERLAGELAQWQAAEEAAEVPWPPPTIRYRPEPGIYYVQKDIPQGRVYLGLQTKQLEDWEDPDYFPTLLMNEILGGGGFTSRITKRIRSDEGLAYSAGTQLSLGTFWVGRFNVGYQSKSETVAFAAEIALDEIDRMRTEPVSDQELTTAKAAFAETFPSNFDSAQAQAQIFATDELIDRPHAFWQQYRERVAAVTREDVLRVAKKYLDPKGMLMLVVGNWQEIAPGDPQGRSSIEELRQRLGVEVRELPQRDPVTLQPIAP